mgnify:CR=1 FL=1
MWAVFKKELKSYFLSPIGYVVVGILLLVASVFFYLTTVMYSSIDLGGLYTTFHNESRLINTKNIIFRLDILPAMNICSGYNPRRAL